METEQLIQQLAAHFAPVRRLPKPWVQAAQWLVIALASAFLVVLLVSPRDDLAEMLAEERFLIEQGAALATAVTAAIAAFCMVLPGYDRRIALLPAIPLALWLGSLGLDCVQSLILSGSLTFESDWVCLPAIAMVGAVPALAMVAMLRRGAPLAPRITVLLGALAAAAVGDFGLRLFHAQDAGLTVLVWQFGSVVLLSALASWSGSHILKWRHLRTS